MQGLYQSDSVVMQSVTAERNAVDAAYSNVVSAQAAVEAEAAKYDAACRNLAVSLAERSGWRIRDRVRVKRERKQRKRMRLYRIDGFALATIGGDNGLAYVVYANLTGISQNGKPTTVVTMELLGELEHEIPIGEGEYE